MITKNDNTRFYLLISSIREKDKNYWIVKIANNRMSILKEFIDSELWFAEMKGLEWIRSKSQYCKEIDYVSILRK